MSELTQLLIEEIKRGARQEIKLEFKKLQETIEKQQESIQILNGRMSAIEKKLEDISKSNLESAFDISGETPATKRQITHILKKETIKPARLIKFRIKHNLAQKHLALLLGCTTFSISHWEKGHNNPSQANIDTFRSIENLGKRKIYEILAEKGVNIQKDFKVIRKHTLNNCRSKYQQGSEQD